VLDRLRLRPFLALLLTVAAVISLTVVPSGGAQAALSGSQFLAGDIISDAAFFNPNGMSEAQIQNFLNAAEPSCSNSSCLRLYRQTTTSVPGDSHCAPYSGAANESAAAIIYKVQVACGVSAQVLLVTLQKEQALVLSTGPTAGQLQIAMGFACPDTAACDTKYYGFFNQLYHAARQFDVYVTNPSLFNFAAGRVSNIQYNPKASCGTKSVLVQNAATAALYNYTPYTPNAAALANLTGIGDSCSAYGNRNFWVFYNEWFGSGNPPFGAFDQGAVSNGVASVSGWTIDPVDPTRSLQVQVGMTTPDGTSTTTTVTANANRPDVGNVYPYARASNGTTPHGYSYSTPARGLGQYAFCVTADASPLNNAGNTDFGCRYQFLGANGSAPIVSRLAGDQRWDTAAAISRKAFPNPGVPVAYIASGEDFADGLSAAPAAAKQGGPVLFVQQNLVPAATMTELQRLKPARIVVVGGTNAVSDADLALLKSVQPSITRIGGPTRYETSRLLAQAVFPSASQVFLATGTAYPDALSAGAAAGATDSPVLLVNGVTTFTDPSLTAEVKTMGAKAIYIAGGTNAVSAASVQDLSSVGATITRFAGQERYQTSTQLASAFFKSSSTAYFASGASYPDALAGAVLAGRAKGPLLISRPACVPSYEGQALVSMGTTTATLFGGTAALGSVVDQLGVCR
jgi:putative cell wall-binding protein